MSKIKEGIDKVKNQLQSIRNDFMGMRLNGREATRALRFMPIKRIVERRRILRGKREE